VEAAALAALQHSAPAPPPRDPNTIAASKSTFLQV